jgi:hypothetical protein
VCCLSGKEFGAEIAGVAISGATLAGLAEFELGVGGEEALVVGWTAEGFFAAGLEQLVS